VTAQSFAAADIGCSSDDVLAQSHQDISLQVYLLQCEHLPSDQTANPFHAVTSLRNCLPEIHLPVCFHVVFPHVCSCLIWHFNHQVMDK